MKVHIEDNLYLESDEYQFVIKEYTGKLDKNNKELFKVHGYFSSIQHAMKHFLKMKVKKSTAKTLLELVEDIKNIEKYIESKFEI